MPIESLSEDEDSSDSEEEEEEDGDRMGKRPNILFSYIFFYPLTFFTHISVVH